MGSKFAWSVVDVLIVAVLFQRERETKENMCLFS